MKRKPIDEETRVWLKKFFKPFIDGASQKELLNTFNQRFADLIESDEPLPPVFRQFIADELRRYYASPFYSPIPATVAGGTTFDGAWSLYASVLKHMLRGCNMSAAEAEQDIADMFGMTVDALRKKFQRNLPGVKTSDRRPRMVAALHKLMWFDQLRRLIG
jgi:hypothetical protein